MAATSDTVQKKYKACLFDMDGLLINSEDIYTEASNELLAKYGKGPLTWDVKVKLQGRVGNEAANELIKSYDLPLTPEELFAETSAIQTRKWPTVSFLPGALELLQELDKRKVPFALATSSVKRNFIGKTTHLGHGFDLFRGHIVVGDDPRVPKGRGKPFPDIWLTALESLNREQKTKGLPEIKPEECLVFEDGVVGVRAGIAAGCTVIWVPDQRAIDVLPEETILDLTKNNVLLKSLKEFNLDDWVL